MYACPVKPSCEVIATHLTASEHQIETEEVLKSEQETEEDSGETFGIDNDKEQQQKEPQPQQPDEQ